MMVDKNQFLLGIVVDISSSMQTSWYNDFTRNESKIEVIKNTLNNEFQRLKVLHEARRDTEILIFCIGIGFILPFELISVDVSDGKEKKLRELSRTSFIGVITDLIALSEIVPSEAKIGEIKNKIQSFWAAKSKELLADVKSEEFVVQKLQQTIHEGLSTSVVNSGSLLWRVIRMFNKEFDRKFFKIKAERLGDKLTHDIVEKSQSLFTRNKKRYEKIITEKLTGFAHLQIWHMLERNALGFSIESILENFDKDKLLNLTSSIYQELRKDISKEFKNIWINTRLNIFLQKAKNLSPIRIQEVKSLTEDSIKSIGWKHLEPFVEDTALKIFSEEFEKITKENFRDWLNLASKREVVRDIKQLDNLLPNAGNKTIYTSEYMFGGTPMLEAINLSSLRLLEKKYENYDKVLLVLSDGEYDNEIEVNQICTLLKNQGITIACGYIGNTSVISKLASKTKLSSKKGARNLVTIASDLDRLNLTKAKNPNKVIKNSMDAKLCIQINHPDTLTAVINVFLEPKKMNENTLQQSQGH
tara:strand:- start:87435 stop:89021 length:1587 start_codon:yes stop_codon:yes gene_type:complete